MKEILIILFASAFTGNIALTYFLGMCPFIAMSRSRETSLGMGAAVMVVMTLTCALNWIVHHLILIPTGTEHLQLLTFILTIAVTVQILEIFIDRVSPALYASMGIFLPLITVNCAILGASLFMILRGYTLIQTIAYGFGSGAGWALALLAMSSIRQRMKPQKLPIGMEGPAITMIIAGIMAMAFTGLAGIM
ncbi:MAG: NADH:ubiquinone reductase (Na(+)-transporting) subunit E [Candidatus Wallbacteria bacterium HGW-Wallbacteria-1]|jgi:Na+-transporting NADH:ubiquinone oxidoreductase subunit E|uniref:NADH:ubiquinone reductase (Na(+)-transporting) subunit E n=1 Tax=Candidatus Wallbacteria bacterium HGW-Wallbacteria-1 TaxID=2013854 RepID=A0A2N1PMD5_9BACT|nr:MAG: NADH:ubiquinone reductase (Na(+)-transporting) subunit E [Candidatus Wallbacteria bacterium HGW-Wallbacteria-1]